MWWKGALGGIGGHRSKVYGGLWWRVPLVLGVMLLPVLVEVARCRCIWVIKLWWLTVCGYRLRRIREVELKRDYAFIVCEFLFRQSYHARWIWYHAIYTWDLFCSHMRSPVFCPSLGITNRNTVILVMLMMHDTIWMEGMLMGAELLLSLLKG
jgi:hypothetical protein